MTETTVKKIPDELKPQMVAVLKEFAVLGVIGRACDNVGVSRRRHEKWLEMYPTYRKRYDEVKDMFVDGLEMIAISRAKEKSDSLLTLLLKAHRREVYGDKTELNHTGTAGQIQLVFAEGLLTDEEKELLKKQDSPEAE